LPQRKEPEESWGLEELKEILAVTSKSEGYNRQMLKNVFAAVRRAQQIVMLFNDVRDVTNCTTP